MSVETVPRVDLAEVASSEMGEGGLFVYEADVMMSAAERMLGLEMPFGNTIRYAAKANPHPAIINLFDEMGLHFDASSANEASRLLRYGVEGDKISLSSQTLPNTPVLRQVLEEGVHPVATSIRQMGLLARLGCNEIAVRINPGKGSGHSNRTNVGGPASSFGIWYEYLDEVIDAAEQNGQKITRLHTHIGSGADPNSWPAAIKKSLAIVKQLPDVETLDIGGGYKVARMPDEKSTDIDQVGEVFAEGLDKFAKKTGRQIKLEMEPGTYLVANAGTLLGRIEELGKTPAYKFYKLNVGMNAILRPSLYGAQHPIEVLNDSDKNVKRVVVGPCCESGDILTPAPGNPEKIQKRTLKWADVGDYVAIGGAGAYCASMSPTQYNDIAPANEIVVY
jgi:diaminopimelate decarboxylase